MTTSEGLTLAFLVNAAVQTTVVAGAAAAGAAAVRRAPAAVRHAVWVAALALAVATPLRSALATVTHRSDLAPAPILGAVSPAAPAPAPPSVAPGRALPAAVYRVTLPPGAGRILIGAYLLLLALRAGSLLRGWARARTLRGDVPGALPRAWACEAERCGAALGVRAVPIVVSWRVETPATVGAVRPVIVLPRRLIEGASPRMAAAMLSHEMAHVRRRDFAWNLFCELLALPLAFHPAVALIRRRIRRTREQACDELAAAVVGTKGYARALVALGRSVESGAPTAYAVGMLDEDSFEERVMRLVNSRSSLGQPASRALLVAGGLVLALGAGIASAATLAVVEGDAGARSSDEVAAVLARHGDGEPRADAYAYGAGAKRDPFMDLRLRSEKPTNVHDPRAFLVQDIALRGVVRGPRGWTAMVLGPDGRTYFVSVGQVFYDGTLTGVDAGGLSVQQQVRDPLSPARVRDLRIVLHADGETP